MRVHTVLVLLLAVFVCAGAVQFTGASSFASLPRWFLALSDGSGMVSAAGTTTFVFELTPAPGSVPVNVTNYFTISYTDSTGGAAIAKYNGTVVPLSLTVETGSTVNISAETSDSGSKQVWCIFNTTTCQKVSVTASGGTMSYSRYYYDLLKYSPYYSVRGGGSGYAAPHLVYDTAPDTNAAGYEPRSLSLTLGTNVAGTAIWAIRGTAVNVQSPLSGSGTTERWETNQSSFIAGINRINNIVYYNQFYFTYTPSAVGGSLSSSNVAHYAFVAFNQTTYGSASSSTSFWADAGTPVGAGSSTSVGSSSEQYSSTPLTYGMSGYWPLTEGAGTYAFDLSGNENTGTLSGGATWYSGGSCQFSSCLEFEGGFVRASGSSLPVGDSAFTKSVWVYLPSGLGPQEYNRLILCWGSAIVLSQSNCLATGSSPDQFVSVLGTRPFVWTATNLVDGWNQIAVAYNGTEEFAYSNGVLQETFAPSFVAVARGQLYVGGGISSYYSAFDHAIAEVRIYGYAWGTSQEGEYYSQILPQLETLVSVNSRSLTASYYNQYLATFSYTVAGGGNPTPPQLGIDSLGESLHIALSNRSLLWLDSESSWTVENPLAGSGVGERWESNLTTGKASLGMSVRLTFFHQYALTANYSVSGGGADYQAPSISYKQFGSVVSQTLLTSPTIIWADSGSSWDVPSSLIGSTQYQRWDTPASVSGIANRASTISLVYYHQYYVEFSYSVSGGGSSYRSPSVNFSYFGKPNLTSVPSATWVDAGTPYFFANPLEGSTLTERWASNETRGFLGSSMNVSSVLLVRVDYYHQYLAAVGYSVSGGGSIPAPEMNYTQFGVQHQLKLSQAAQDVWIDAGSDYSVTNVLSSTVTGERWIVTTQNRGAVESPAKITFAYQHQYYVSVISNSMTAGEVGPTSGWYDSQSSIVLTESASHGWLFTGWIGSGAGSYTGNDTTKMILVDGSFAETAEFEPALVIETEFGGSVSYSFCIILLR